MKSIRSGSLIKYGTTLFARGLTIGSKFLFTFFLGKFYPEEVLGEYGLFATTVLLCYFILSLSFDSYGLREFILKPFSEQAIQLKDLLAFYLVSFVAFIPVAVLLFVFDVLRWHLLIYFLIILFLETFNQVLFGLFTILSKQVAANWILFINQGAWILVSLLVWYIDPEMLQSVDQFLFFWCIGSFISVGYGLYLLIWQYGRFFAGKVNWSWIKGGLSISMIFFFSTLAYKVVEFTDRYLIEFKLGLGQVGIYVFYSQVANLINALINVVVIIMLYPVLITYYSKGDIPEFIRTKNKMSLRMWVIGISLSIVEVLLVHYLLQFLGKESFSNKISTFYVLLVGNLMMNLSFVPHYCLYAFKKDMTLLLTTVSGAVVNFVLNLLLIGTYGILGAAISTLVSFALIWGLKAYFVKRHLATLV